MGAWVCLVAVALLWAPLWATAWQTDGMDCCKGGMCMAHRHSKPNPSRPQQTGAAETSMDCEHHSASGMSSCPMACGPENSHTLATPTIFVMPEPALVFQTEEAHAASQRVQAEIVPYLVEPPSPPPRNSSAVA